jgi:hypothetical protein
MMADQLSSLRQTKVAISVGGREEGVRGRQFWSFSPRVPFIGEMDCACFHHNKVERGSVARVGVEQYTVLAVIRSQ